MTVKVNVTKQGAIRRPDFSVSRRRGRRYRLHSLPGAEEPVLSSHPLGLSRGVWSFVCNRKKEMTNAYHVKAFRLFELQRAESEKKHFRLEAWEQQHLQECAECQSVVEVFARQFDGQPVPSADRSCTPSGTPRFKRGDHVRIVSPGEHHAKSG